MRLDWTSDELFAALGNAWYSPHAPRVVEMALALLIALQLWAIWRSAQPEPAIVRDDATAVPAHARFGSTELSRLLDAHLFGEAPAEAKAPALAPSAFKLVGLYVPDSEGDAEPLAPSASGAAVNATGEGGASEALAYARTFFGERTLVSALPGAIAWVSVSGAPGQRVQLGQQLGGGTVRAIAPEGVTLELQGRRVHIAFPENPFLAMLRGETNTVLVASDPNAIPAELSSPALRFLPELLGDGLTGFRVYPGSDEAAFAKTGLRAGDVIEAIDGRAVTMPRDVIPLLTALRDRQSRPMRVRRGAGSPLDLNLFATSMREVAGRSRVVLPPGYRPSPVTRPAGLPPPKPRAAPPPPPDLASPPPSLRRSASP
ncbi:MAG: hypothetical protein MUF07_07160 [Steroidobacteraceae bacterium]|jgi:hypothetical protein|nr:hypothetical protein [Steroidobacteraceae bacterium]